MNETELYPVKEYKFDIPLISEIDSVIDSCFKDCLKKYFHKFKYECIYDTKLTNNTNKELINLTIIGRSMNLYDLNKNIKVARQNGFVFNQLIKLLKNFSSHKRYINKSYYLNFQIPMCHRQFFIVFSQNQIYVESFRNDMENPFQFACHKVFNQLN